MTWRRDPESSTPHGWTSRAGVFEVFIQHRDEGVWFWTLYLGSDDTDDIARDWDGVATADDALTAALTAARALVVETTEALDRLEGLGVPKWAKNREGRPGEGR